MVRTSSVWLPLSSFIEIIPRSGEVIRRVYLTNYN